jgi:hypothetical protein
MKKNIRWIVGLCILLAGCQNIKPKTINGSLIIQAAENSPVRGSALREEWGVECYPASTLADSVLDDVSDGQISIKDETGKILGIGKIGKGSVVDLDFTGACSFPFSVQNIPEAKFYSFEVNNHKGESFPYQRLESQNWKVILKVEPKADSTIVDGSQLKPATEEQKKMRKLTSEMGDALEKLKK